MIFGHRGTRRPLNYIDGDAGVCSAKGLPRSLAADRPYRGGMPPETALAIMNKDRGVKLDATAIDALASAVQSQEKEAL